MKSKIVIQLMAKHHAEHEGLINSSSWGKVQYCNWPRFENPPPALLSNLLAVKEDIHFSPHLTEGFPILSPDSPSNHKPQLLLDVCLPGFQLHL